VKFIIKIIKGIMKLLNFYKIKRTLKSFRRVRVDKTWFASTRRELEVLTSHKSPRKSGLFMPRLASVLASVLILVLAGGGTVFASQSALPSDTLYPFKLFVERVQGVFVFGDENKANFALGLAERRIDEAELEVQESFELAAAIQEEPVDDDGFEEEAILEEEEIVLEEDSVAPELQEEGEVIVSTIFRAQDHLASVQDYVSQLRNGDRNLNKLEKIFNRLDNLERRQQKLAQRLRIRLPQLAQLIEVAGLGTVDVKNEVDKVLITIALNTDSSTTTPPDDDSTTSIPDLGDNASRRAQQVIDRAERKIATVEAKLERFGGITPFMPFGFEEFEERMEEMDERMEDMFDDFDDDNLPPGLRKQMGKFSKKFNKQFDKFFKKFEKRFPKEFCSFEEAKELIEEARELLDEAKEEFAEGDYAEAAEKAREAFSKAVQAEGKINYGICYGFPPPEEPEEPEEPDTTPPVITSGPIAFEITTSSAKVGWRTDELSDSVVEYGTSSSYGMTATDSALATSHVLTLSDLDASTTYHYRVSSTDEAGNTVTSGDETFSTNAVGDITPPEISDINVTDIGTSSATITWTTNEPADSEIEYGLDDSYGSSASSSDLATSHSVTLTGLDPDTEYHFRVKSRDGSGNLSVSGGSTFNTEAEADTTPPEISAISADDVSTSSATITWTTNEPADSEVEYGLNTSYGQSASSSSLVTSHSIGLLGLSADTEHHFRVKSKDEAGNLSISGDNTFTTATSS
jgi:hypothetical protein